MRQRVDHILPNNGLDMCLYGFCSGRKICRACFLELRFCSSPMPWGQKRFLKRHKAWKRINSCAILEPWLRACLATRRLTPNSMETKWQLDLEKLVGLVSATRTQTVMAARLRGTSIENLEPRHEQGRGTPPRRAHVFVRCRRATHTAQRVFALAG